jgi:uncharacterized protein (DUF952 family)
MFPAKLAVRIGSTPYQKDFNPLLVETRMRFAQSSCQPREPDAKNRLPLFRIVLYVEARANPARLYVPLIYKICPEALWRDAEMSGRFNGAPIDLADGYIHFSTGAQARETAAKHFAGQRNLLLIAVDTSRLGEALRHEPSRGGALFPHLYAPLDPKSARWIAPLPLAADGTHLFPEDVA